VLLHVDILGLLDIDARELSIDAVLYDSRIAVFTITGDFAVRLNFGPAPAFAVSAGGFHPRFTPPPGFPEDAPGCRSRWPRRTTRGCGSTRTWPPRRPACRPGRTWTCSPRSSSARWASSPRRRIWASTRSSTWSPGSASSWSWAATRPSAHNGQPMLNAEVSLTLTGPEPFHISGYAEIDFFGKHRIEFDKTIGQEPPPAAPPPGDPIGDLLARWPGRANWRTTLPPDTGALVILREPDPTEAEQLLLHPFGAITVEAAHRAARRPPRPVRRRRRTGRGRDAVGAGQRGRPHGGRHRTARAVPGRAVLRPDRRRPDHRRGVPPATQRADRDRGGRPPRRTCRPRSTEVRGMTRQWSTRRAGGRPRSPEHTRSTRPR